MLDPLLQITMCFDILTAFYDQEVDSVMLHLMKCPYKVKTTDWLLVYFIPFLTTCSSMETRNEQ